MHKQTRQINRPGSRITYVQVDRRTINADYH